MRVCENCKAKMAPYVPRQRVGDQMLCDACVASPRGGYVSASLRQEGSAVGDPQSFEEHFNSQVGDQPNDVGRRRSDIGKDSDELHERYKGQPGTHGIDEGDWPFYQVDHPSGWHVRTHGGPYLEVGHQATPGEAHDVIDVGHNGPNNDQEAKIHPALTQGTPEENHNMLAKELSAFVGERGEDTARANPRIKKWQEMHGMTNTAMRKHAHDSGDGETIYHCPFCGSGQVIARSDRTIECEFCHTCFTVQVQPEFSAFPQTIDGQPVQVPGMPGQIDESAEQMPPGAAPDEDEGAMAPGGEPESPDDQDTEAGDDSTGGNPFTSKRVTAVPFGIGRTEFLVAQGRKITTKDYLAHLAIATSPDREQTLDQVRRSRRA